MSEDERKTKRTRKGKMKGHRIVRQTRSRNQKNQSMPSSNKESRVTIRDREERSKGGRESAQLEIQREPWKSTEEKARRESEVKEAEKRERKKEEQVLTVRFALCRDNWLDVRLYKCHSSYNWGRWAQFLRRKKKKQGKQEERSKRTHERGHDDEMMIPTWW